MIWRWEFFSEYLLMRLLMSGNRSYDIFTDSKWRKIEERRGEDKYIGAVPDSYRASFHVLSGLYSRSGSYIKYINQPLLSLNAAATRTALCNPRAYRYYRFAMPISSRESYIRERARNVARYYMILCNCRLTSRRHLLVSCGSLQVPTFARTTRFRNRYYPGKKDEGCVKGFSPLIGKRSSDATESGTQIERKRENEVRDKVECKCV